MKNNSIKKIKYAILHFGYVESYGVGSIVVKNTGKPFVSEQEAKDSLAQDLLRLFKADKGITDDEKPCCLENSKKKYCPDCGRKIGVKKFDTEDIQDWLEGMLTSTIDDIGGITCDCEEVNVWELGHSADALIGTKNNEVLVIDEQDGRDHKVTDQLGLEF